MIFASSMEVYGYQDPVGPFEETLDPHPACPYAVAKFASEKYLQYLHYAHEFPAVALRQTNCYGRRENDYFIVERIATQMMKGDVVNLGAKDPVRNFIFITDLLDLYITSTSYFLATREVNSTRRDLEDHVNPILERASCAPHPTYRGTSAEVRRSHKR